MKRILIVEDDPFLTKGVADLLSKEGFEADCCGCVEDARSRLGSNHYHLVVTDYRLSGDETGLDLLTFIQMHNSGIPVILISGSGEEGLSGRASELGAFEFVSKPFRIESLISTCRDAIGG